MPKIDVSDILADPDFCEVLAVTRRAQSVDTTGRAVVTTSTLSPIGVVEPDPPPDVDIGTEFTAYKSSISVYAYRFRFFGPTDTNLPDIVVWRGTNYLVKRVEDWSKYGKGFSTARCEAQDLTGST